MNRTEGLAALPIGIAPLLERHAWAKTLATDLLAATPTDHPNSPMLAAFARRGIVSPGLVTLLLDDLSLYGDAARVAEMAWLVAYVIEAGADALERNAAVAGELYRDRVPGWGALQLFDRYDPPEWWPWPEAGECEVCSAVIARGAATCEAHDEG